MYFHNLFRSQTFGLLLTMVILNGLYVNQELTDFFKPLRYGLLGLLAGYLAYHSIVLVQLRKAKKNLIFGLMIHVFLLIYALGLSSVNGGYLLIEGHHLLFSLLGVFVTLYALIDLDKSHLSPLHPFHPTPLGKQKRVLKTRFNLNFNFMLPVVFVIAPFLLFATESLTLLPLPRLTFSLNEETSLYSQGTTSFFAVGSIVFIFLATAAKNFPKLITLVSLSLVMICLSALAGARGNFLVGVIVIFLIVIRAKPFKIGALIFLPLFLLSQSYLVIDVDDFLILRRLSVIGDGNFGMRDVLLIQSIDLLSEEIKCLSVGCGFNYFQIYYGYEYGMYPHNIFAETLITYGIFIGVLLLGLVIIGIFYGFFSYHRYFVYWVLLYFIGISLKSGSLMGYTSITTLVFFAYLGLSFCRMLYIKLNNRANDLPAIKVQR